MSHQLNYGGQAVMEGVMMRGSRRMAVAVRAPDHTIVLHEQALPSSLYSGTLSRIPFVRGLGLLWDSLGLGVQALNYSARVAVGDGPDTFGPVAWGTMVFSLLFFVAVFFLGPRFAADVLQATVSSLLKPGENMWYSGSFAANLVEGLIRLALVIGYIWLIGRISEIQRVFAYHGAEHKTINAYEDGAELTPQSVARYPLTHPRCGTGFLLVIVVISVIVFAFIGDVSPIIKYSARVLLVPVIAVVAYEYLRFMARHLTNPIVRFLIAPQLALQRLTNREPSLDMLEVSICALERVLEAENLPLPVAAVQSAEA